MNDKLVMKNKIIFAFVFIVILIQVRGQTSPCLLNDHGLDHTEIEKYNSSKDTITFNEFADSTIITDQYQDMGVIFSGYKGSTAPIVYDYSPKYPYGKILHSDDWFNPMRINFVERLNPSKYHPAKRIEFDNVVDSIKSQNLEVDYMSIDVYDSSDVLIRHYLSSSPERVVLDFGFPAAAYIVIDDSAGTSYALDNIFIDFGPPAFVEEISSYELRISPNPASDYIEINLGRWTPSVRWSPSDLKIYNSLGECVLTHLTFGVGTGVRFDISALSPGVYYMWIGDKVSKFVKI